MKTLGHRTFNLAFRAWLDGDETGRNAELVAAFVIEKALGGHFAYFKLLIDLVEGNARPSCDDEATFEGECLVVSCDDNEIPESSIAA
jgi:hypothetical protein